MATLVLALLGCGDERVPAAELSARLEGLSRPHLVLVVVDTLRADATNPWASTLETSPELDEWAQRGIVFERTLAQSSWTKISMASMMTSLWPHSHGLRATGDGLDARGETLAEHLRHAGYATFAVQTNGWLHQSFGFHEGFDRYTFPHGAGSRGLARSQRWPHADRVVEEAGRLIEAAPEDRPFFLYLHFMDVHEYAAPPEWRSFGTDRRGNYLAAVRWVDDALGRIRRQLDQAGVLDRTVIVFASDHGETFGEHDVYGHARNVLTPVLHVPLVIRFPFVVGPAIRVAAQVRNVDIAPTLLELAGIEVPASFEGASLLPLLASPEAPDRPNFAALGVPLFPDASVQAALNEGRWTYARNAVGGGEADGGSAPRGLAARAFSGVAAGEEFLFDRGVDPGENVNLVARHPEEAARMRVLLDEHLEREGGRAVRTRVAIDAEIAERLRAMGYLR